MKKIAVITNSKSDFLTEIEKIMDIDVYSVDEADFADFSGYNSFCIIGGVSQNPLVLNPKGHRKIECEREKGKKVFAEYCFTIGDTYFDKYTQTSHNRLICATDEIDGIESGDLLDEQCNRFYNPIFTFENSRPILSYENYIPSHDHTNIYEFKKENWGLWFLDSNTMICSFRLCNFIRARFTPKTRWDSVISFIINWISGEKWLALYNPICEFYSFDEKLSEKENIMQTINDGINWFFNADMLISNGEKGVLEGLSHHILPDGEQIVNKIVRADCCGEVSGALRLYSRLYQDKEKNQVSLNLEDVIFDNLIVKDGIHKGMVRWSNVAYWVCYQDDVSRAVIPFLVDIIFGGSKKNLSNICDAMNYLLKTTGCDGLRVSRTDCHYMTEKSMQNMREEKANCPSVHYNGYYFAALLMLYKITLDKKYFKAAEKGINALMDVYPFTMREHSETQEICRLILPLACLYEVTNEKKHLDWLLKVEQDLQKFSCENGGYKEWDTGYKAVFSHTIGTESSLLSENGDSIIDLLYSNNWLPFSFAYSYRVTKNIIFKKDFLNIARFLRNCQIKSKDKKLDGGWARAFDYKKREVYGMPHDAGWGPWCMETGWTVGEILFGLEYGLIVIKDI